jgi:phosphoserine aminotransferase
MIEQFGDLETIGQYNGEKAQLIYDALEDRSDLYKVHAAKSFRSPINVAFDMRNGERAKFISSALSAGFSGLEGHRTISGFRASLYNAMTLEAARDLASFLRAYRNN